MKPIAIGIAALVAALTGPAWAVADQYPCSDLKQTSLGMKYRTCGETEDIGAKRMQKFRDNKTGRIFAEQASVLIHAYCKDGICVEIVGLNYGEVVGEGAADGHYYIQRGYQLVADQSGNAAAIHPEALAEQQQIQHQAQASNGSANTELYCSNMSDTCTLTVNGQELELTREELPKHVGFYQGDLSSCIAESCLGSKGEFLGLNPDYYQR